MIRREHRCSGLLAIVALLLLAMPVGAQETAPSEGTITVAGFGEVSAAAETARLQIAVSQGEFFGSPRPLEPGATPGAEERESVRPVLQALLDAGVPEEDIEIVVSPALTSFYGPGGPGLARLDLTLEDPDTERVNEVIDAVAAGGAEEGLLIVQIGVAYDVADCSPVIRDAREAAIADARAQAEVQAELLGVSLGDIVASEDALGDPSTSLGASGLIPVEGNCPQSAQGVYQGAPVSLPAFDPTAPAEVEVYAAVNLSFAIASS